MNECKPLAGGGGGPGPDRDSDSDKVFTVGVGTASYCAPEQRSGTGRYTSAVDRRAPGPRSAQVIPTWLLEAAPAQAPPIFPGCAPLPAVFSAGVVLNQKP